VRLFVFVFTQEAYAMQMITLEVADDGSKVSAPAGFAGGVIPGKI
jgi:hypothetical protein